MLKRIGACAIVIVAGVMSGPASAGYFGLSIAQNTVKDWDSSVIQDGSVSSMDIEDSDMGFRFVGGFELSPAFAFEVGYSDFGEVTADGYSDGNGFYWFQGPVSVEASADGFDLGLVGRMPVSESFSFIGRLGVLVWDVEGKEEDSSGSFSGSDDGNDVFFGLGGEFGGKGPLAVRAEFTRYSLDDSDLDSLSLSVIYRTPN